MDVTSFLMMFGGIALFLYGMNVMGSGLEKVSGGQLEKMLEKMTNTPLKGVLLGTVVTAMVQSSTATIVMVVGFVNSGIMKLSQATGVIMGASIGTTVTAWILSLTGIKGVGILALFKPESFTPIFALIGVVLLLFSKRDRRKNIGSILVGFAVLMFGMITMSDSMEGLSELPQFRSILTMFGNNPILGLLVGIAVTAILQSSSASIGILQAMSVGGAMTFASAIPLILGANIGACVTGLISCIGASKDAKRAAFIHLYFKIIGVGIWMAIFYAVNAFVHFPFVSQTISVTQIAIVHTLFNILNMLTLFPFSKLLEKLTQITIGRGKGEEDVLSPFLDERFLRAPSFAVEQCKVATVKMAQVAKEAMIAALDATEKYSQELDDIVVKNESQLDKFEDKLGNYLVKLSSRPLSQKDGNEISRLLHAIGNFERIGDHALNVLEAEKELRDKKINFSESATKELGVISGALREILDLAITSFETDDTDMALKVEPLEQVIDSLKDNIRARHIQRLQAGQCTIELGFVLSDLLSNYERVSDHCSNIAVCVMQLKDVTFDPHQYLMDIKTSDTSGFIDRFEEYQKKYPIEEN